MLASAVRNKVVGMVYASVTIRPPTAIGFQSGGLPSAVCDQNFVARRFQKAKFMLTSGAVTQLGKLGYIDSQQKRHCPVQ